MCWRETEKIRLLFFPLSFQKSLLPKCDVVSWTGLWDRKESIVEKLVKPK